MKKIAVAALSLTLLITCRAPRPSNERTRQLTREAFNRRAAEKFLPLFWREDTNKDGMIQPTELAVLWVSATAKLATGSTRNNNSRLNSMRPIGRCSSPTRPLPNPAEQERHKLVLEELAQGRPTLVETNLSRETPATVNAVRHLMSAARLIEHIYAKQKGVFGLDTKIPAADAARRICFTVTSRHSAKDREPRRTPPVAHST